jgi:hypothetical protein
MSDQRKKLVKSLDKVTSAIIRLKEKSCVICGSENQMGNGHVFSRKSYSLRWDLRPDGNCHNQCWSCNYRHVTDQYPYFDWYIKKFGQKRFDELRREFKTIGKLKDYELEEKLLKYKEIYYEIVCSKNLPF